MSFFSLFLSLKIGENQKKYKCFLCDLVALWQKYVNNPGNQPDHFLMFFYCWFRIKLIWLDQ